MSFQLKSSRPPPSLRAAAVRRLMGERVRQLTAGLLVGHPQDSTWTTEQEQSARFAAACFGASFLVAIADGEFGENERIHLYETMAAITAGLIDSRTVDGLVAEHVLTLKQFGVARVLDHIVTLVKNATDREAVFCIAVGSVRADGMIDKNEQAILEMFAHSLKLSPERARELVRHVIEGPSSMAN